MQQMMVFGKTPKMEQLTPSELTWLKELGLGSGVYLDDRNCKFPNGFCHINNLYYCMENPEAEIVSGWLIWKSQVLCELEFHSVVRHNGWLMDLTKRSDPTDTEVLFFEEPHYWAKFDKGITHTFHNIIFPKMGRKRMAREVFAGDFTEIFQNFGVKGRPVLSSLQQAFLHEMAAKFF